MTPIQWPLMNPSQDGSVPNAQQHLRYSLYWFLACAAAALSTGIPLRPSLDFTIRIALLGVVWFAFLMSWRTRQQIWRGLGMILFILVANSLSPNRSLLSAFFGLFAGLSVVTFLVLVFRQRIARFCNIPMKPAMTDDRRLS